VAKSRGLPPSFQLDVPREALAGPVQLGDYLDEEVRPAVAPRPAAFSPPVRDLRPPPFTREPQKIVQMRRDVQPAPAPQPPAADAEEDPEGEAAAWRPSKNPPRKQVNMNPETLRMMEELLTQIQNYSGQKDAKASEMFHALVSALYEARELLDFNDVQPRGKWGSPTARAFPVSLKNAFRRAIAEWQGRN
jgi:hypothetical protein